MSRSGTGGILLCSALFVGTGGLIGYSGRQIVENENLKLAPKEALERTLRSVDKNGNGKLELFEVLDAFADKNSRQISDEALQRATVIANEYMTTAIQMDKISKNIFQALDTYKKQQSQK